MYDQTHEGAPIRLLNVIDEFIGEALLIRIRRRMNHKDILESLNWLFLFRGIPAHIRSDNGSGFTASKVRDWPARMKVRPSIVETGSPWENSYIESFNGKLRDELQDREIFHSVREAQVLIEDWC